MPSSNLGVLLIAIASLLRVGSEAAASSPTPNQTTYGFYRYCVSEVATRALRDIAAQTVEQNDVQRFSDFVKGQEDCSSKPETLIFIQPAADLDGSLGWAVVYDPGSSSTCDVQVGDAEHKIPCRVAKLPSHYWYAYYRQPSGRQIVVLVETFETNFVEGYLQSLEP